MLFISIFGWFFKNPIGQKIGLVAICVIAFLFAARWWANRAYYQGVDQGIKTESARMLEAKKVEWQAREDELKKQEIGQAERSKVLTAQQAEIDKMRLSLNGTLYQIQAQSQAKVENSNAIVNAIPAGELDPALRAQSAKLGPPATSAIK